MVGQFMDDEVSLETNSGRHHLIIIAPGYWKRIPDNSPPRMPFFTTPMAKDICVDVGPGMHWPRASSSMNTPLLIQFKRSTNVCTFKVFSVWLFVW
jgi:hypothetical protein